MNIFNKKKYLDCFMMKHALHFFYDEIRMCCSNSPGPIFYPDYSGSNIDWDYIYKVRKNCIKEINSIFSKKSYPEECIGCFEILKNLKDTKIKNFPNKVKKVYFQNYMSCNAKCSYCTFADEERGYRYKVVPIVKSLIEKEILSKNAHIYMSGGEITISPEFEELLSILLDYVNSRIEIISSGIKYCKSIEDGFSKDKLSMLISLDSGTKETYKKIKNVDCFDSVVSNIKRYIDVSDNAKQFITLKYIILDGVNDNINEISEFFNIVSILGVKTVRLDVDFQKYSLHNDKKVPLTYAELYDYFVLNAKKLDINISSSEQVEAILNKK